MPLWGPQTPVWVDLPVGGGGLSGGRLVDPGPLGPLQPSLPQRMAECPLGQVPTTHYTDEASEAGSAAPMHLLLHLPAATPSTEGPAFGPGRGFPKLGAGGATEGQGDHPHQESREPSLLQGIAGH